VTRTLGGDRHRSRALLATAIGYAVITAVLAPISAFVSPMAVMLGDACSSVAGELAARTFMTFSVVLVAVAVHTFWAWWTHRNRQAWLGLLGPPIWLAIAFGLAALHYRQC
jgi:ABC-type sugar transport system permease subunit